MPPKPPRFRPLVALILCLVALVLPAQAWAGEEKPLFEGELGEAYSAGKTAGSQAAQGESVVLWWALGAGIPILCVPCGCIGVNVAAHVVDHKPKGVPAGQRPAWEIGYADGFQQRMKKRVVIIALIAGIIGTVVGLGVNYLVLQASGSLPSQTTPAFEPGLTVFRF